MSVINREDAIAKIKGIPYVQDHPNIGLLLEEWLKSLPDAGDGWIPYTGHDQNIECGRYLVQTKESMVCATYGFGGFVFPFYVERIVAFRPLPKPYKPKEDN